MRIAVGIPVRNALAPFKAMFNSLLNYTNDFTLFICNDASDKLTSDYIKSLPAKRIIVHKSQQWFTRSSNDLLLAGTADKADYIFLLNSDIILCPGWYKNMLYYFKDPKVALVGSVFVNKNMKSLVVKPPDYVTGHAWCIKTEHLKKIGILDESFIHIQSDVEFCYRLHNKGFKAIRDHKIPIMHKGGASWGHKLDQLNRIPLRTLSRRRPLTCITDSNYMDKYKSKLGL